jgi:hypothetical protein
MLHFDSRATSVEKETQWLSKEIRGRVTSRTKADSVRGTRAKAVGRRGREIRATAIAQPVAKDSKVARVTGIRAGASAIRAETKNKNG